MALEMRPECERCTASLEEDAEAYICTFECSFCGPCKDELDGICPNCSGELVRRPRKATT